MTEDEISSLEKEIEKVVSFPDEKYIEIIREVGFECDYCGRCCTSEFNDHVFLLDEDAARIIEISGHESIQPAPYYDLCDNLGRFYVMGYALKNRSGGECIFYTEGKCEHYASRPAICRIYPYMLHREEDEEGHIDFRQISGLSQHGFYHNDIEPGSCKEIIREVKKYEIDFLEQKIRFFGKIKEHFLKNDLKPSRQMYDRMMREYEKGKQIEVFVFFKGNFVKESISKQIINPQ